MNKIGFQLQHPVGRDRFHYSSLIGSGMKQILFMGRVNVT
jgi:hypothetical protein